MAATPTSRSLILIDVLMPDPPHPCFTMDASLDDRNWYRRPFLRPVGRFEWRKWQSWRNAFYAQCLSVSLNNLFSKSAFCGKASRSHFF